MLSLLEDARQRSEEDALLLTSMTSEDGNGLRVHRSAYLAEESGLDELQRMQLLAAANYCERLIWLFAHMIRCILARSSN